MTRTERWDSDRWPEVERESRRRGRARDDEDGAPIVNPYAIVALVAALLGLFPVAIVFGMIAFGHPRGRAMASFALLIGLMEVGAIVSFVMFGGTALRDFLHRADSSSAVSETVQPTVRATPATTTTASAAATTTPATTTAAATGTPVKGQTCTEAQVGLIGTAADGSTLLCLFSSGVNGGYKWAGPYAVASGVQQTGTSCDPSAQKSARTTDGRALVCEGQGRNAMWVPWTE
ncbi:MULTISPECIES: hypothetical protein [unclassified Nocardia]|uniref:hypothetical protein n=1 Tax=unclassified Nocardia TaxID=2637762 RepID=UPI001CE43AE7|nr:MULTISPECIES: hypothetical protein [unclassified Nocardia]